MKTLMKKENLFLRVAIGFALGIIFGFAMPALSLSTAVVGQVYLILIKMMIIPILFCAVCTGIMNIEDISVLRRVGVKTVLTYAIMFVFSFIVSLAVAFTIRPGLNVVFKEQPVWEGELASTTVSTFLLNIFPSNVLDAMSSGKILPTIVFTMLLAISIVMVGKKAEPLKEVINSLSSVMFQLLSIVMEVTPIGVMSLMAFSVAKYGAGMFTALGKYILCCWVASILVFILVMFLPTVFYTGISPKKFLSGAGKIALMTLSTTSSAATLPTTIKVSIEEFKAPSNISEFTLPLGCTINMCGGAASFSCLAVFVADFYGLSLSLPTLVGMVVVATMINMAAPGIPGGGIVLGASFLSIFGLPFDLMGPIAAFYRLLDMAFTTLNVEGDIAANLMICKSENAWSKERLLDDAITETL